MPSPEQRALGLGDGMFTWWKWRLFKFNRDTVKVRGGHLMPGGPVVGKTHSNGFPYIVKCHNLVISQYGAGEGGRCAFENVFCLSSSS